MSVPPVFSLQHRALGYQRQSVLTDVSLDIVPGERVALLGRSGSGKTTLLRSLRQLQPALSAWCPQQHGLVPMLSVYHNVYMGALSQHSLPYNLLNLLWPLPRPRAEIAALVARVGLTEHLFAPVEKLSGGQQSRTNVARALYQRCPVFLGDEPTAAVDEVQADQLLNLIVQEHQTVVLALHDVTLALKHCTRIIGLQAGRIEIDQPVQSCSVDTLMQLYSDA